LANDAEINKIFTEFDLAAAKATEKEKNEFKGLFMRAYNSLF
jgi:hypothetical protein